MPRGRVPSLLSANNSGIIYDVATRSGKCSRCSIAIASTSSVGLLKYQRGGFTNSKRLCLGCVSEIVNKTQADLDFIKAGLDAARPVSGGS